MTKKQHNNSSPQSPMLRFVVSMVVFVVIVATAIRHFSQVFDNVEVTEANNAVQSFATSIISLHKNWIMQGRPDKVVIKGLDNAGKPTNDWVFIMNSQGWPINVIDGGEKPDCNALWYALQKNNRLAFSGQAIMMRSNEFGLLEPANFNDRSQANRRSNTWVCQNIVAQQLLFRYRLDTGKVELD